MFSPEYELIINALISAREAAKLTQSQLARRLRKPQSFVSKYERCERRLDVAEYIQISRALERDPSLILKKIEDALSRTRKSR